jgi:aryl-alcohol dehydrogenase-like predicted oxidoreductase
LRWILDQPEVSCVIPGFKNVRQVEDNLAAQAVPSFDDEEQARLLTFYAEKVYQHIRGSY